MSVRVVDTRLENEAFSMLADNVRNLGCKDAINANLARLPGLNLEYSANDPFPKNRARR